MKRKNLMTVLMCAALSAATAMAPISAMAEETEAVTEISEDAETEAAEEDSTEADTEGSTEESTEEEFVPAERPDYTALDYVELGEYKGLTVALAPIEVTDDEIINQIRVNAGSDILEELTEGTVEMGDIATIDYEGKLDGVAFDGGTANGYDLGIGSHSFIDGFEEGLVGVKVGDTVDLPLTFPENYGSQELAGQGVIFTVTVHSVKRMPELTDEIVTEVTDGEYTEVEAYKESIRAKLLESKEADKDKMIKSDLLMQIAASSEIKEYPQEMVDYVKANMTSYYRQMAESSSMELADFLDAYLGMTEEEFDAEVELVAKQNLQVEMYLKAIAEAEEMELTDDEFAQKCEEYAALYNYATTEELVAAYGEATLKVSALQDKAIELVQESATVEEKTETEAAAEEEADTEAQTEEVTEADTEAVTE